MQSVADWKTGWAIADLLQRTNHHTTPPVTIHSDVPNAVARTIPRAASKLSCKPSTSALTGGTSSMGATPRRSRTRWGLTVSGRSGRRSSAPSWTSGSIVRGRPPDFIESTRLACSNVEDIIGWMARRGPSPQVAITAWTSPSRLVAPAAIPTSAAKSAPLNQHRARRVRERERRSIKMSPETGRSRQSKRLTRDRFEAQAATSRYKPRGNGPVCD